MNVGKLRRRISLRTGTETQDPNTGVMTPAGVEIASGIPAAIEPLSAREFIASGAMQARVTTRITIRHRADVVPTMRIVDDLGKSYGIEQVLPDKDSGLEYLTIVAREEPAQ